ncbi:MAG: hypothetical protein Unbinned2026contig1000_29 [Prokaryotic dsDNA virus sp.]|nr:MAG: hypothetical protein Unbinned2026contig1000_29 [Prokaryotic dsDNA virus sp.]|tara:strand:+ start:5449 stop:8739 length:3291 start_codon:yes stop_codon:yes gene_type:complete
MTSVDVTDVLKRTQSTANGSTTDFTFSFQVNATNEIKVYEDSTLKTEGTHYTIVNSSGSAGLNANGTGVVKFKTSPTDYTPANNKVITILSVMSLARASVYSTGQPVTAGSLETDFDRLHRIAGDFKEVKSRTLIAPEYSATNVDMTLPAKASRLGKVMGFNSSSGNPEMFTYLTNDNVTALDGLTAGTVLASKYVLVDANKDITGFRNITLSGELDAGSLDVSGDADIDGTLEADAITVDGTALNEYIADTVGAMVGSNTETGISVTYEDGDNTLDFVIGAGSIVNSMLADDAVGADELASNAVVTASIVADAVTGAKIADDQIDSEHYVDGSIDTAHIASGAITADKIADGTVVATEIASNAVTTAKINADAVTGAKIADDAIDSEHYTDGSIDTAHIANDQITNALMADDAINSAQIADGAIDTVHIADLQVTTAKIANDAITEAKIADDAINSEHYTDGSIDTAHIADDQITQAKIADDAVGADQLASSAVVTASIVDDNVTQAKIADDAVGADQLASSAVVTASIVDNAVTLAKMAGLARGKLITGDSSGDPSALAIGTNGQYLKSDGSDLVWGSATISGLACDDLTTGDGAVSIATTSGNITIDAQGDNTDIIFKGTDDTSDTTFLTLDGSEAGTATFNSSVNVGGDITISSTDAGSGASPSLVLYRNSSSPATYDLLGELQFKGENSADEVVEYATLVTQILDKTDGSEDGRLAIQQMKAGTLTDTYLFDHDRLILNDEQTIRWNNHAGTSYEVDLVADTPTAGRTITLPDATGTVLVQDSSNDVIITSTDAGATDDPSLILYRNTASPADSDDLGEILFRGRNDNSQDVEYAKIWGESKDVSDGEEDGKLHFDVMRAGTLTNLLNFNAVSNTTFSTCDVKLNTGVDLIFEGATNNANETTLTVADPSQDNTITLPDATGTVLINSGNQTISSGNLVFGTAGKGIDFSANTHTSSGTMSSEVFDSYEEGTFTATPRGGDAGSGAYTKIGNLVTFTITVPSMGCTSNSNEFNVAGLPFTSANNSIDASVTIGTQYQVDLGDTGALRAKVGANGTTIFFYETRDNNTYVIPTQAGFAHADAWLLLSGSYLV